MATYDRRKFIEATDTISGIKSKMTTTQVAYATDSQSVAGISPGQRVGRYSDKFHVYAYQTYIDVSSGTITYADNIFGALDLHGKATYAEPYTFNNDRDIPDVGFVNSQIAGAKDYYDYNTTIWSSEDPDLVLGRTFYNSRGRLQVFDATGVQMEVGTTIATTVRNNHNGPIVVGDALWYEGPELPSGGFNVQKATCAEYNQNYLIGIAATPASAQGDFLTLMERGVIYNIDTSGLEYNKPVYLSGATGALTTTPPPYPCRHVIVGAVVYQHATEGILAVNIRDTSYQFEFEGSSVEKLDIQVRVDAGTIYCDLQKDGGGDFHIRMGNTFHKINATSGSGPSGETRIELTAGAATSPVTNYIYAFNNAGTVEITHSTTRPNTNYAILAECSLLDSTTTDTYNPLMFRRWTNSRVNGPGDDTGLITGIAERLRLEGARYYSGISGTLVVNETTSPDQVKIITTAGVVYQLWSQIFPAYDTSIDGMWVANASGNGTLSPYQRVTDFNELRELADGTPLSNNSRVNYVVFYCMNSAGYVQAFVNLPTARYGTDTLGYRDPDNTAVVSVPSELKSTAFLGFRVPLRYRTGDSGRFTTIGSPEMISLLGNPIGLSGSSNSVQTIYEFPDNLFKIIGDVDPTKTARFESSGIATGTERVYDLPNRNGELALLNDSVFTNATTSDTPDDILALGDQALTSAGAIKSLATGFGSYDVSSSGWWRVASYNSSESVIGPVYGCVLIKYDNASNGFFKGELATCYTTTPEIANRVSKYIQSTGFKVRLVYNPSVLYSAYHIELYSPLDLTVGIETKVDNLFFEGVQGYVYSSPLVGNIPPGYTTIEYQIL